MLSAIGGEPGSGCRAWTAPQRPSGESCALPDALYVELAARLGTVVVTTDQRLARATPLAVAPPEA